MNERTYRDFFLEPKDAWHRRYEALRACFVECQPLTEVARQFGVGYGTLCNWVSQFRAQCDAHQRPPFFCKPLEAGRRQRRLPATKNQTFKSPTWKRCP